MTQAATLGTRSRRRGFYVWVIRGTPQPVRFLRAAPGLGAGIDPFGTSSFFNTGACNPKTVRDAIRSVSTGQMEAGYCAGIAGAIKRF